MLRPIDTVALAFLEFARTNALEKSLNAKSVAAKEGNPGAFIERRFNHDLLLENDDREAATRRWPRIAQLLINPELCDVFSSHERLANRQKRAVQWFGTFAVALMLTALIGATVELWKGDSAHALPGGLQFIQQIPFDACALLGVSLAGFASRYGPIRRRWLRNRFMTEVLRQWHFRRLLDTYTLDLDSKTGVKDYLLQRSKEFAALLQELKGTVGQKMDRFTANGLDPLGDIPDVHMMANTEAQKQLHEAFRVLRIDHQLEFMVYKLSEDDKTFLGFSLDALVQITDQLAGLTLFLALGCSIVQLYRPFSWAPFAAVTLALAGVAVRTWRDGLALGEEKERYQETLNRLERLRAIWDRATHNDERSVVHRELERTALEEMRSFIRAHGTAQFLF